MELDCWSPEPLASIAAGGKADMRADDRRHEVFITEQLAARSPTPVDHLAEKRALQDLARRMVDRPDEVLPRFVDLAVKMTGSVSAGLSLFEADPTPGIFRWHHVRGRLARFDGATTPRNDSPCGVTLDEMGPVLTRHSERMYSSISEAGIEVPEVLLVPLYIGDKPLGTLWIVSDDEGHFNAEHARIATELATFVGIALQVKQGEERLRQALEATLRPVRGLLRRQGLAWFGDYRTGGGVLACLEVTPVLPQAHER